MQRPVDDILQEVDVGQSHEFRAWKHSRPQIISALYARLSLLSESDLVSTFSSWESSILKCKNKERTRTTFNLLMALSMLSHFQDDLDQVKNTMRILDPFLSSASRDVVKAAAQVLFWAAGETSDGSFFFREAIQNSFSWIQERREPLLFNALYIIKRGKRFAINDVTQGTQNNFMAFFAFTTCDDVQLRHFSVKIIIFMLKHTPPKTTQSIFSQNALFESVNTIVRKSSQNIQGPIQILIYLYGTNPHLFDSNLDKIIESTLGYTESQLDSLAVEAYTFILSVLKTDPQKIPTDTKMKLVNELFSRGMKSPSFFDILSSYITELKTSISFEPLWNSVMTSMEQPRKPSANLLSILCQISSPSLIIPETILLSSQPCIPYLQCLVSTKSVSESVIVYLSNFMNKGLSLSNPPSTIQFAMKIAQTFPKELFSSKEAMISLLTPLYASSIDQTRISVIDALASIDAIDFLISVSLYDQSKQVRFRAISSLKSSISLSTHKELLLSLTDSCFKVRRQSLCLNASLFKLNPFDFSAALTETIESVISSLLSVPNVKISSKYASLLPTIAKFLSPLLPHLIPSLISACLFCLNSPNKSAFFRDDYSQCSTEEVSEPKKAHLFLMENSSYIDDRDINVLKALACFGDSLLPQIDNVLEAYYKIFVSARSKHLVAIAAQTLAEISAKIGTGINLRKFMPSIIQSLLAILGRASSKDVYISVLKLLGTACDHISISHASESDISASELGVELRNPSFFTDFVLRHLSPYFSSPTIPLFEAVSRIIESSPLDSAKFLPQIYPSFIKAIYSANERNREELFDFMSEIVRSCPIETMQFVSEISKLLIKFIGEAHCMLLCATMAFCLVGAFASYASKLYFSALMRVESSEKNYIKPLMKFLSFCIVYQNQPFDLLLSSFQGILNSNFLSLHSSISDYYINRMAKTIQTIVVSTNVSSYSATLFRVARQMVQMTKDKGKIKLLFDSLIKFAVLPKSAALGYTDGINNKFNELKLPKSHFKDTIQPSDSVFNMISLPLEINISKWLEELCEMVVSHSPSCVIRCCAKLLSAMQTFRSQLFPIAFLSCWQTATLTDRTKFSSIVQTILKTFKNIDPFFPSIAELLDRACVPLLIDDLDLAKACESRPLSLYFLQRIYRKNPKDLNVIESLLHLNTSMGRYSSARGILIYSKNTLDMASAGKWSELLGEWDKAFQLYEKAGADLPSFIRCLSHLEQWNKICEKESDFLSLPQKEREKIARHFARAFYHTNHLSKVKETLHFFSPDPTLSEILFLTLFQITINEFDSAQRSINLGFTLLSRDSQAFTEGDESRANQSLAYAQLLVELQESLNEKKSGGNFSRLWNKRLKGFKRDGEQWIKIIEVRNLIIDPGKDSEVYVKMISVLRKERRWNLIDSYFERFFAESISADVELAHSKILWERGQKKEAIDLLRHLIAIIEIYEGKNEGILSLRKVAPIFSHLVLNESQKLDAQKILGSDFSRELAKLNIDAQKAITFDLFCKNPNDYRAAFKSVFPLTPALKSSIYRSLGDFILSSSTSIQQLIEVVSLFSKAKDSNQSDRKSWSEWAYANSRLSDMVSSERDSFALNAIVGFLKASKYEATLEYLCQLFSSLFKIDNSEILSTSITEDLLSLDANSISQVVPQITVQISHKDIKIRSLVHNLLLSFGSTHFQAIYFPLKLYENGNDSEKAKTARNIILDLSKTHSEEFSDAELFADGMLRAAISWFEEWMATLDSASRSSHEGNIKRMDEILEAQFRQYQSPRCDLDRLFIRLYDDDIKVFLELFREHSIDSLKTLWEKFRGFFNTLSERVKKLELILIPKVSEALAKKVDFKIAIPGTYRIDRSVPRLEMIEPALQVLGTQQHPRCVFMVDSDNNRKKFLLKGNEDLRLDQRVMQFFVLINLLLGHGRTTKELGVKIVKYAIVPLAPTAGLISWVTGSDTLHQMINEQRANLDKSQSSEYDILGLSYGGMFHHLNSLQKLEGFEDVAENCPADEVRDSLWAKAPNAATWLHRSKNFTLSTALMSMVGYLIGLGDRHPSNIMIQRDTGRVIHIDFGDTFETAVLRQSYPEKVPFRLTRMIVNALDGGGVEGLFRKTCEDVMWVLRDNRSSLVAQLEIFIHEPLEEEVSERKDYKLIINRVKQKLCGRDTLYVDPMVSEDAELGVEAHVDQLIRIAADPARYVTHYGGWCCFW